MQILAEFGWFGKSMTAMISIVPLMVLFNFFGKYGLKPEAIIFGWFFGVIVGIVLTSFGMGLIKVDGLLPSDLAPTVPMLVMIFLGVTVGSVANMLLGQAIPISPNPALPFAIVGLASALAYVAAPIAAMTLPRYFDSVHFGWVNFVGMILLALSVGLIMYKTPA